VIEVSVAPDRPIDAEPGPRQDPLSERLRAAYQKRLEAYDRELASALGILAGDNPDAVVSRYPQLAITIDVAETVTIDNLLFTTLFDIYVTSGWSGILVLEDALRQRARPDEGQPSGGTSISVWPAAWRFFVFTRNLLALLIRDGIVEIEQLAARRIIAALSKGAAVVAQAWSGQFQLTREVKTVNTAVAGMPARRDVVTYRFGDQALAEALYRAMKDAVDQRVRYEQIVQRLADVREDIKWTRSRLEHTTTRKGKRKRAQQRLESLKTSEQALKEIEAATRDWYASMTKVIYMNCALALLVLDGLKPGFTQKEMEQLIGEALWPLYERIDELGFGIDPDNPRSKVDLPGLPDEGPAAIDVIERLDVPREGFEASLINRAVDGLNDRPAYFALLHEGTLHTLVSADEIDRDSFAFVVYFHYVSTLIDTMDAIAQSEKAMEDFWKAFSKGAAALSLASLAAGQAEIAPFLRLLAGVGDFMLLAHSISSIVNQLAQLDRAVSERLINDDAFALESLRRVAELIAFRRQLQEQIGEQLLLQLILIVAAVRWAPVKKLLIAGGYLLDVQTLLSDG
jgi:hypothetical protein